MIPPEMIRKGDFVWLAGDAECWCKVTHLAWVTYSLPHTQQGPCWYISTRAEPGYSVPTALELVHVLMRDGVEIWNADTSPVQMALFEDDADLMEV